MPVIRDYPQATSLEPTDAFVIDREGVGTMYVEASVLQAFPALPGPYYDDANAAANGVSVGGLYRNGSVVQIRVS